MPGTYLAALLVSLAGLTVVDRHWRLAYFYKPRQAALVTVVSLCLFVAWDLLCIHQHIFFEGHSGLLTGLHLAPNFPIEEIGFLLLLNYTSLLVWTLLGRRNV